MPQVEEGALKYILWPYGVTADKELCSKIIAYMSLLELWNRRISLTTITEPENVLKYHFGESFFAASSLHIAYGRLADVGTGAGFPGIPMKMICPKLDVTLIEANGKKCAFLSEVVRKLNLSGIKVVQKRMEDFTSSEDKFDFVTARAVGQEGDILRFSSKYLSSLGKVVLWLSDADASFVSSSFSDWRWSVPKRIPCSERKSLLVGMRL